MNLTEVTKVPLTALPLQAYRDHLRLGRGFDDDGLQDAVLESTLLAAISAIENRTGKALLQRQFRYRLAAWESATAQSLPRGPIQAVQKVAVVQQDGHEIVAEPDSFQVLPDIFRPTVRACSALPIVPIGGHAEIVFDAGYGPDWGDIPESLAQATFILAAHFYEARDGEAAAGLPRIVRSLIDAFREIRVFGGRRR